MNNILQIIRLAVCLALTLGSAAAWPQAAGYPFTVTVQGDGTVQINLTEPACVGAPGASVTCVFEAGGTDKVTLTASANSASSVFTGWSGANFCTGIEVCRFSISGPGLALTAAFQSANITPRTGYWFNPAEGGRGFNIEQRGNNLFMATFLYGANGGATWFGVGPGAINGATYTGILTSFSGGQTLTGAFQQAAATGSGGAFSITFTSATQATITWPGGTLPIQRYDFGPGGSSATQPAGTPEAGWWYAPTEGGRGYAIEIQGGSMFLAGYMYDAQGNPIWYASGPTPMSSLTTYQGVWQQFGNGQTLTGAYQPPTVVNANVGNVSVQFTTTTTGILTFPEGRQVAIQRYTF